LIDAFEVDFCRFAVWIKVLLLLVGLRDRNCFNPDHCLSVVGDLQRILPATS